MVPLVLAGRIGSARNRMGQRLVTKEFTNSSRRTNEESEKSRTAVSRDRNPTTGIQRRSPPIPVHAETQTPTRTLKPKQLLGNNLLLQFEKTPTKQMQNRDMKRDSSWGLACFRWALLVVRSNCSCGFSSLACVLHLDTGCWAIRVATLHCLRRNCLTLDSFFSF